MNELFNFHKHLNVKKVLIVFAIILVLLILMFIFIKRPSDEFVKNETNSKTTSTFVSDDESVSLDISNKYGLEKTSQNENYLLELRSLSNISILVTGYDITSSRSLEDITNADKKVYISDFNSPTDVSDTLELNINNHVAYTYSFHYTDSETGTLYYLQTIWVSSNNKYYIIDIDIPLDLLNDNGEIINEVMNTFNTI